MTEIPIYLLALFLIVAFIYGSVGHGGASGYIAIFTLTGYLGSRFGVNTMDPKLIRLMLTFVLVIAGLKMLMA